MGGATKRSSSTAGLQTESIPTEPISLVKKVKGGSKRKIVLTSKDEKCAVQNIAPKTDHVMLEPSLMETKPHVSEQNYLCSSFMLENNPAPTFIEHDYAMAHNFTEPFPHMHHHHYHHAPSDMSLMSLAHQPVATGLRNAAAGLTSLCQNNDTDYYESYLMNGIPTSLLAYDWQNRDRMAGSKGSIPTMKIAPKQPVPIKQKPWSSIGGTASQLSLGMYSESMSLMGSSVLRPSLESSMSISGCFAPQFANRSNRAKDPKRAEHIACEHKRRFRIKNELNRLNEMVPGLMGCPKNSQAKILQAAADYMEKVIQENARIKMELAALRTQLSSAEPKDEV